MRRTLLLLTALIVAGPALADGPAAPKTPGDLFFREALYHAHQGEWFDAIARIDTELQLYRGLDEPKRDALYGQVDRAEYDVGDFELAYRMHQRAGRAFRTIIDGDVDETVRNGLIYRLARLHLEKGEPVEALQALGRLRGEIPAALADDLPFLQAQVLMDNDRFDEAVPILEALQDAPGLRGFAPYNLGIALIRAGLEEQGRQWLDRAGQIEANDRVTAAIRDKANLLLGEKLLDDKQYEEAKQVFDRVRLSGPFSNRALLGSGWADAYRGRYDLALVPWSLLAEGETTDPAVQEVLLAVPYAYGRFALHGNAAMLYGWALENYSGEIAKLDASIRSIDDGRFLAALRREEVRQDAHWVVRLRELPAAPETHYLLDLLASNDFQDYLKNYLDLDELRRKLERGQTDLEAFAQIVALRRAYYEPLLPQIDQAFSALDRRLRLRLEQRDRIRKQLQALLVTPRPEALETTDERTTREQLRRLEPLAAGASDRDAAARIGRLRGLLFWDLQTGYDQRLTAAYADLQALDREIDDLNRQVASFARTRQAALESFQGYDATIRRLQQRTALSLRQVGELLAEQGGRLEIMATNELTRRKERLEELELKARFALADSYDRASRAQKRQGEQP